MMKGFGSFLEQLRGSRSLREAAKLSGLSHAYIRDLELEKNRSTNERIIPSPDTLKKLSAAYNYPYKDLMTMAGHLYQEQDTEQQVDFTEVLYAKIMTDHVQFHLGSPGQQFNMHCDLPRFHELLKEFEAHSFKRLDTELFVNIGRIRAVDWKAGTVHFEPNISLRVSPLRLNKHQSLILRSIAEHNGTTLEYNVDKKNGLKSAIQSIFTPSD
ncbi:helix-turn-helix transcriptional regulator [Paenibacillus sp. GD4]|uniref:helix-turn-helix domain-containing protein n=1 Tax=Paenibacillus sp. GD4 TaxID=3068890 RepID=UPI002796E103|nr:helix-turn-helix transcriptional regulator [Paenibacillus sp. GD4]MDQ1914404.1 helix-turn-helix transcriptional regulator [Paenibacillus sp. GD4]